jgi:beta-glucosidase
LEAYGPGQAGGTALAEILFGLINPSGKLPLTYPRATGQIPVFYNYKPSSRPNPYADGGPDSNTPLYPFGHGLSYTTFDVRTLCAAELGLASARSLIAPFTDPLCSALRVRSTRTCK